MKNELKTSIAKTLNNIFGAAQESIPLSKYNKNNKYKELIYIFCKNS